MDYTRLLKEDVIYELRIRGCDVTGDISILRKRLAKAYSDKFPILEDVLDELDGSEEFEICRSKYDSLSEKVEEFDYDLAEFLRLEARLSHLTHRIKNIRLEDSTKIDRLLSLVEILTYLLWEKKAALPINRPGGLANEQTVSGHIKMYKWGINFSGDSQTSLHSFLEDIEEKRRTANVSKELMFQGVDDLLKGSARIWFRANRDDLKGWDDLVAGLKSVFRDPDYDRLLWDEIKNRTQGRNEPHGVYISKMQLLFKRLSEPVTEKTMLDIISKNLRPEYLSVIGLMKYSTIRELHSAIDSLALGRVLASRFKEPNSKPMLEPDMAYTPAYNPLIRPAQQSGIVSAGDLFNETNRRQTITDRTSNTAMCWNCGEQGHRFRKCPLPRKLFCNGCGRTGVKIYQCESCRHKTRKEVNSSADREL